MIHLFGIFLKIVMFLAATIIMLALCDLRRPTNEPIELNDIPEYNYVPQVRQLIHKNCFGEASELCGDIIREQLPGAEEAKALKKLCDNEIFSAGNRISRALNGFITGSSGSLEEAGGAIASDLIIYGDIRDLVMQGYFKITGQETDYFIIALSSIGLTTSLVQWADWMPSILKLLRKTGGISENFARVTVVMVDKTVKSGKADPVTIKHFSDLSVFLKQNSFPRSLRILKYAETPKDLAMFRKLTEKSSTVPYLLLTTGGQDALLLIRRYGTASSGTLLLKSAARRGPAGIAFLRNSKVLKQAKWGARVTKAVYVGHVHDFIYHTAKNFPPARWGFLIAAVMMYLYSLSGFYDVYKVIKRFKEIRNDRKKLQTTENVTK